MANVQVGYGHSDVIGQAFDFYSGAIDVATGNTFNMQTGILILFPAAAVTGVTVNLPLNPVDGAYAEIDNVGAPASTVTLTVVPNTGDVILAADGLGVPTVITVTAATTSGSATASLKY